MLKVTHCPSVPRKHRPGSVTCHFPCKELSLLCMYFLHHHHCKCSISWTSPLRLFHLSFSPWAGSISHCITAYLPWPCPFSHSAIHSSPESPSPPRRAT